MVKRKKLLFCTRLISCLFALLALASIFSLGAALAKDNPFSLEDATIIDKSNGVDGGITEKKDNGIYGDVVFHRISDYVTYKLAIQNNTDSNVTIKSITDNSDDNFVEYQYDGYEGQEVESNGIFELTVKAIYKTAQTDISKRDYTGTITFTIEYTDDNGANSADITVNPSTGDEVRGSIAFLAISIIGLIVCIFYGRTVARRGTSKFIIPIILALMLVPAAASAATYVVDVVMTTDYSLYDKVVVAYTIDGDENTLIYLYGDTITGLEDPDKENYNFVGWTYEDGTDFDVSRPITSDVKIVAKFERKNFTLVFDANTDDTSVTGNVDNQVVYFGDQTNINANEYVRSGYKFLGWNTKSDGTGTHFDDGAIISLPTEGEVILYAEWIESTAVLLDGNSFNDLIVELNSDMVEFKKSNTKPDLDNLEFEVISTDDSNFPVYAWDDNGIIYWWSEAEKVYMNSNCDKMFYAMAQLTNVDFTGLDSSRVTTMNFMFQYCASLRTMDLRLDTSNVTSMDAMFANCTSLTSIDFSHIDMNKVENLHGLVAGCTSLVSINLTNVKLEGAKNFESMFSTLPNLTEIDLSSFDTPNLNSIYFMFLRCSKLTTIYATDKLDISKVTDTRGPLNQANSIVGGAGTAYNATNAKKVEYFRIDDPDNGKPGYLTLKNARYIRYDGNGADGGDAMTSHYLTTTTPGNLKTNTFTNTGKTFVGWNTKSDGSGESYADGQLIDALEASKTPLTLYAVWE